MVKLSLGSWFGSSSNDRNEAERKKQNRRTFSAFGTASPLSEAYTMGNGKHGEAVNGGTVAGGHDKLARSSTSTEESDREGREEPVSMTALAEKISRETAKLERYMKEKGLPMPSFDVDAADDFPKLPEDIQKSRLEVIHATKQLRDLTVGPRESVRWGVWEVSPLPRDPPRARVPSDTALQFLDVLALQVIYRYKLGRQLRSPGDLPCRPKGLTGPQLSSCPWTSPSPSRTCRSSPPSTR